MDYGPMTPGTPHQKLRMKYKATVDRILPRSLGGEYSISNSIIICHSCNQLKADRGPDEMFELAQNFEPTEEEKDIRLKKISLFFADHFRKTLDISIPNPYNSTIGN